MVEHLKVLSLTVEPAFASLSVEHLKVMAAMAAPSEKSMAAPLSNK